MATSELSIKVDVTGGLHKALKEFAKQYAEEYDVTVESVRFNWGRTMGIREVYSVDIETSG